MLFSTDIELTDIQSVESALEEKLRYYKMNFPSSIYEIGRMETALSVLNDLVMDIYEDKEGQVFAYIIDFKDNTSAWGYVCAKTDDDAAELVRAEYDNEGIDEVIIDDNEELVNGIKMEIGEVEETGEG